MILTDTQKKEFYENGYLILKNFYNIEDEIKPLQKSIYDLIGLVIDRSGFSIKRDEFSPQNFYDGYLDLIGKDRKIGGLVYDIIKWCPEFIKIMGSDKNVKLFKEIRDCSLVGICTPAQGIRIDNPNEEKYLSHWHQEFLYQPQSIDGIVYWSPLVDLTSEMGPVKVCSKSHLDGMKKYFITEAIEGQPKGYSISIDSKVINSSSYEIVQPTLKVGDLILMDYLTIHSSGRNVSNISRWSMQLRYFNFNDKNGKELGWLPPITVGTDIESIFSKYISKKGK